MIKHCLTILGLSILGLQDYRNGEISFMPLILLIDFKYIYGYLILGILLLTHQFYANLIGGADLIVTGLLLTRYNFIFVNLIIMFASVIACCVMIIKREKKLFFIPYILLGYLVTMVIH